MITVMIIIGCVVAFLESIKAAVNKFVFGMTNSAEHIRKKVVKKVDGVTDVIIKELQPGLLEIEAVAGDIFEPDRDLQLIYDYVKERLPLGVGLKVIGPTLQRVNIKGKFNADSNVDPEVVNKAVWTYLASLKKGETATLVGVVTAAFGPLLKNVWDVVIEPTPSSKGIIGVTQDGLIRAGRIDFQPA